MELQIVKKEDVILSNREEKVLKRKVEKLEKILGKLSSHNPSLRLEIDRSNRTKEFLLKGYLHIPENLDLTVTNSHQQLIHALDGLFKALTREVKRKKEKIIDNHRIEKDEKIAFLTRTLTPEIENAIAKVRPELIRFAKRMAAAHLYHEWETLKLVDFEDVVDEAIEKAVEEGLIKSANFNKKLLYKAVAEVLMKEIEAISEEKKEEVSIEEDVPLEPPEEEVSDLGSEIFDFYQPDAWLKLEDLIPSVDFDGELQDVPDLTAMEEEIVEKIKKILPTFSSVERKVLTLFIFEELEPFEIAMVLGKKTEEVHKILVDSLKKLLRKLREE